MINQWMNRAAIAAFSLIALILVGCSDDTPPTVIVPVTPPQTVIVVLPTETTVPATPIPTDQPTPVPLFVTAFRHRTGVFAINTLEQWELLDNSTDQRILVRLLPPMGYGSRITIDITNEGSLTPEEVKQLAESYVRLNYVETAGYQEVTRNDLEDGRLQFVFLYDDTHGATGRETLTIQQTGPFFSAMRVFLSDRDTSNLGLALDQVAGSFAVDPLAAWGTRVAAINPAELRVVNALLWQDRSDNYHYTGELLNASPADITAAEVTITFCDEANVVVAEITQPIDLRVIGREGTAPFAVMVEDLPDDTVVCRESATAKPASPDPSYTIAVGLDAQVSYAQWAREITVEGALTNYGLAPVNRLEVMIIVYNADNQVIGYIKEVLDPALRLDPGQSYNVEIKSTALKESPHHVATAVQAQIISQSNPSLAPTTTLIPTP